MSFGQIRIDIESYLVTNFLTIPADNIVFDNMEFEIPDANWMRVSLSETVSDLVSVGGNSVRVRKQGLVIFQIFTQKGKGSKAGEDIAETLSALFEAKTIGGATFSGLTIRHFSNEIGWHQVQVVAPFRYDNFRSVS